MQVTRYTSALTLQVLGNAKGVLTTALSIFIFRNPYTVTSVTGYLITVAVRVAIVDMLLHCLHRLCRASKQSAMTFLTHPARCHSLNQAGLVRQP